MLDYLGYENRYSFVMPKNMPKEFHPGQTAEINVNGQSVGIMGKLHPEVTKEDVFTFEINLDKLLAKKVGNMKYKEIYKKSTYFYNYIWCNFRKFEHISYKFMV